MANNLKEEIKKTALEYERLKKVRSRLEELNQQISTLENKLSELVLKVDKESKEFQKLKEGGLKSMFYKILGSKEEQLEKERQEYLQANLQYDEAVDSLELLRYERQVLESKVGDLPETERLLADLMKRREQEILSSNPQLARQLRELDSSVDERRRMIFEMEEAIAVGTQSLQLLDAVISKLADAMNWGQWTMSSGRRGRMMTGNMKYRNIDHAKSYAYKAKISLQQFEKELREVYGSQNFNLTLNFGSFANFTNIFFDNLITDWIVLQKINNTLAGVRQVRDRVYRLVSTIKVDLPKVEEEIIKLEQNRADIVAGLFE